MATGWFASNKNPRVRTQKDNVTAGNVLDTNGIILATTVDGERVYQADEAARRAIVHLLGDSQGQVSNGVETFQTSYLYGFQTSLPELILSTFRGEERRGDDVTLTVDSRLCTEIAASFAAHEKSAGKNGAAVVMNYQTGAVIAMVSLPNFDPMNITEETARRPGQPFWNRADTERLSPRQHLQNHHHRFRPGEYSDIRTVSIQCTGGLEVDGQAIRDYGNAIHGS